MSLKKLLAFFAACSNSLILSRVLIDQMVPFERSGLGPLFLNSMAGHRVFAPHELAFLV
jgi:hypothetical protein